MGEQRQTDIAIQPSDGAQPESTAYVSDQISKSIGRFQGYFFFILCTLMFLIFALGVQAIANEGAALSSFIVIYLTKTSDSLSTVTHLFIISKRRKNGQLIPQRNNYCPACCNTSGFAAIAGFAISQAFFFYAWFSY